MKALKLSDLEYFVGRTLENLKKNWKCVRVVKEDGVVRFVTEDFRPTRLNVEVVGGIVTKLVEFG